MKNSKKKTKNLGLQLLKLRKKKLKIFKKLLKNLRMMKTRNLMICLQKGISFFIGLQEVNELLAKKMKDFYLILVVIFIRYLSIN